VWYIPAYLYFLSTGVEHIPPSVGYTPPYKISSHLSARVGKFNPRWNDPNPPHADEQFKKAMEYAGTEFVDILEHYGKVGDDEKKVWWKSMLITSILFYSFCAFIS